jgi:GNAT superfamily N-acetyltransferase
MNLKLNPIHSLSDPVWYFMTACLEEAFPVAERRSSESLAALLNHSEMTCNVIVLDDHPIGILNTWDLSLFRYIEHFAIVPSQRGKGFGKWMLHDYIHEVTPPVILEVEPPDSSIAQRRIQFYENEGFVLCSNVYCQPAYDTCKKTVALKLMEYGNCLLPDRFDQVVDLLYQKVYQTDKSE